MFLPTLTLNSKCVCGFMSSNFDGLHILATGCKS